MLCRVGFDGSPLVLDRSEDSEELIVFVVRLLTDFRGTLLELNLVMVELLDGVAPMDMLKGIECNFACSTGDVVINS